MPAFSVNVIARDSVSTISDCLESLRGLSDDLVIVVDSRSTDASEKIAGKFTTKIFNHKFIDFADQRNFAVTKSVHAWILSVDADEVVSRELREYLNKFREINLPFDAFAIKRHNFIFQKLIKHSNWDPNGIVRLFDKTFGKWSGKIHETWESTGKVGLINLPILHNNYKTVEEFMSKLEIYTTAEAEQISHFSIFQFIWCPTIEFFRRFIFHVGFLDGFHGLFLSFLMWIYQINIWIKVWQKEHIS